MSDSANDAAKPLPDPLAKTEEMVIQKCLVCERFSYQIGAIAHPWHKLEGDDDFPQAKQTTCPDCVADLIDPPGGDNWPPSDQYPTILF